MQRFSFQRRDQREEESVTDYKAVSQREYGTLLDEETVLSSGLASETIQRKLLAERELTFERSCEIGNGNGIQTNANRGMSRDTTFVGEGYTHRRSSKTGHISRACRNNV